MSHRDIAIAVLVLSAGAAWVIYQNRQAAAAAQQALTQNGSSNAGPASNDPNTTAMGDLNQGAGSFG